MRLILLGSGAGRLGFGLGAGRLVLGFTLAREETPLILSGLSNGPKEGRKEDVGMDSSVSYLSLCGVDHSLAACPFFSELRPSLN